MTRKQNTATDNILNHDRATALHKRLLGYIGEDVRTALLAGAILDSIRSEHLYSELGSPSWGHYIEHKLGVSLGWSSSRIAIHRVFGDDDPAVLPSVAKLRQLTRILRDPKEMKRKKWWLEEARRSTLDQLKANSTVGHRPVWFVCLTESQKSIVLAAIDKATMDDMTIGDALTAIAAAYLERKR